MTVSFPSSYGLRTNALSVIESRSSLESASLEGVMKLVSAITVHSSSIRKEESAAKWQQFAVLLEALKRISLWLQGRKIADPGAALQKEAASGILEDYLSSNTPLLEFEKAFQLAHRVTSNTALQQALAEFLRVPFPLCEEFKTSRGGGFNVKKAVAERPKLAFLNFKIDGRAAKEIDTLRAGMSYEIEIDLRLNAWPKDATMLLLTPVSLEPKSAFELPTFEIEKADQAPEDDGAYKFSKKGRLIIRSPQSFGSRPYEFNYSADFEPFDRYSSFDVIGHRSLRLEGVDLSHTPLSGFENVDQKLIELRSGLRAIPRMNENIVGSAMTILAALGGVSQQALSDASFSSNMDETTFQNDLIKRLRANPTIGEQLEVHPQTGGGIADLSFKRLRLELKVDLKGGDFEKRLSKYAAQAHQYAVSSGREIALLGVLRPASKVSVSSRAEDIMELRQLDDGSVVFIVQILCDLPLPSSLSR